MTWSFLKALENPSTDSKNLDENDGVYVHPMVKRSASVLSTKSLEMCTESLGSETGSEVSESGDEFGAIPVPEREIEVSRYRNFGRKTPRSNFPPPLTSISGSDGGVKVRHHREDGRLVIKAVSFYNCGTNFEAERTNGRLKLSLLRESCVDYESEGGEMENCEDGDDVESEEEEGGGWWEMDGNERIAVGKEELKMVSRCKEGRNEKQNVCKLGFMMGGNFLKNKLIIGI